MRAADSGDILWFVNTLNGARQGTDLKRLLRSKFGSACVADLACDGEAQEMLQSYAPRMNKDPQVRCVVCGGDGTVGWVLNHIRAVDVLTLGQTPIAVLPVGTGNDLARVLGWGGGVEMHVDEGFLKKYVDALRVATPEIFDQWAVHVCRYAPDKGLPSTSTDDSVLSDEGNCGVTGPEPALFMTNYLGLGIDAQVAQEFDVRRKKNPQLFFSRLANKCWYAFFGVRDFLRSALRHIKVEVSWRWRSLIRYVYAGGFNAHFRIFAACPGTVVDSGAMKEGASVCNNKKLLRTMRAKLQPEIAKRVVWREPSGHRAVDTKPPVVLLREARGYKSASSDNHSRISRRRLCEKISVILDGHREVALPANLQGLVVLNINSFMGGGRMWNAARQRGRGLWWTPPLELSPSFEAREASAADGFIEVVAVDGSLHLARILLGMAKPHQIGQGSTVEIISSDSLPVQVDGEPRLFDGPWKARIERSPEAALFLRNHHEGAFFNGRHRLAVHLIKMYDSSAERRRGGKARLL